MLTTYELEIIATKVFLGERVEFRSGDALIQANLHQPVHDTAPGSGAAIVLAHGLGGNRDEAFGLFLKTAATLAMRGFTVLRFDFRGAGETGGPTREISLKAWMEDLFAALDFVRQQPSVDANRLGVLGLSMGGLAAACLLSERDDIQALSLWEAPFNLVATMTDLFGPMAISAIKARGYLQAGLMQLGPVFFDALEDIHPATRVSSYTGPVLIVHGSDDRVVPSSVADHWRRSFENTEAELFIVPGADHAFTRDAWAWQAIGKSAAWFAEKLPSPAE